MRTTGEEILQLPLDSAAEHLNIAKYRGIDDQVLSDVIQARISRTTSSPDVTQHSSFSTPPTSSECNQSGPVHLADPVQSFQHHQQLAHQVRDLEVELVTARTEQAMVTREWAGLKDFVAEVRVSLKRAHMYMPRGLCFASPLALDKENATGVLDRDKTCVSMTRATETFFFGIFNC